MSPEAGPPPPTSSEPLGTVLPGARFGDLQLIREVGRGAQGVVYEGRQLSVGRSVAVKILPKDMSLGTVQVDRFRREAEAAGRLSHPNIVSVFGLEESGGHMLLMQEFVTGGSLGAHLDGFADEREPERACRRAGELIEKLARALHHAHGHGVIHRDIKPDNVLLTEDGEPKITDFGLARMDDKLGLSQTGAIMGTPHYMSPEQVTADPSGIDARADVYALGSLLYRLLTGVVPFEAKTLQGIFNDILSRAPRPPRGLRPAVPPDLEAVCLKALEKSPDDRYQTARDMAEDLQRFLVDQPTLARPVSTIVRGMRSFQRQATSTLALLVLLVPTAWICLDALLLVPLARGDASLHTTRLGGVALATLLLGWPSSILMRRLLRRQAALAAGAAWVLALLLGAATSWLVVDQRQDQLLSADRAVLAARLEQEAVGGRPDVSDLTEHVARWANRLGPDDALLLARGFLKRERPTEALNWVERLDPSLQDSPVHDALLLVVGTALGRDELSEGAAARLSAGGSESSWREWKLAGDVLSDMKRTSDAHQAYLRAGREPDAPRDELNLQLAKVSAELCAWEDSKEYLDDYRKWFPDDPAGRLVLVRIAEGQLQWDRAVESLEQYLAIANLLPRRRYELLTELMLLQGRTEEAWAQVEQAMQQMGDDNALREWCGAQALDRARSLQSALAQSSGAGDSASATAFLDEALLLLTATEALYAEMGGLEGGEFTSELGLAATLIKRSELEPEHKLDLLERALTHAERAVALDPGYWQAHYNLGHALVSLERARNGGEWEKLPFVVLLAYVGHMASAIQLNGLEYQALNNAAWVQGNLVHEASGDPADLEQALAFAQRAVRVTDPAREGGACERSGDTRRAHSSALDTLRGLQERAGDLNAALASARAARTVLSAADPRWASRDAQVQRLQAAVDDDGG